jgi:hypothetical protein
MKRTFLLSGIIILLASCSSHEVEKSHLLEYRKNGIFCSPSGYAVKYTAYQNSVEKSNIWNIYGYGADSISIWVPDSTLTKSTYAYPSFSVMCKTSDSRIYRATSGEFRLLGIKVFDLVGDFHFKLKNIENPNDSLTITEGYFMTYLQYQDSLLAK